MFIVVYSHDVNSFENYLYMYHMDLDLLNVYKEMLQIDNRQVFKEFKKILENTTLYHIQKRL